MKFDNTYIIYHNDLTELIDNLDSFESRIEMFKEKHPEFKYEVKVEKSNEAEYEWMASINITKKDEKYSTKTS